MDGVQQKLDSIAQELEQLEAKKLELLKEEHRMPFYQRLFRQPNPDSEVLNRKIKDLKIEREQHFKIRHAAASVPPPPAPVPKKDWSNSRFYSQTLRDFNFDYPFDQMCFYLTGLIGAKRVAQAFWKSYNLEKAKRAIQLGIEDDIDVYVHRSGCTSPRQVRMAFKYRHLSIASAIATGIGMVGLFSVFVQVKNKNRFK
jgi:hypothetical protein